jgi:hypothetical protein
MLASTPNVVSAMLGRVPSPSGDVHSSREGDAVVNHHDFLMVAGTRRMRAVELQMDAWMFERVLA